MRVFLDTEFTNFEFPSLISIGLVSEAGAEFYAEVPYPVKECSEFVLEVVIPLLSHDMRHHCSADELSVRLREWLESCRPKHEDLVILFDTHTDWLLFKRAMKTQSIDWCKGRFVETDLDESSTHNFYINSKLAEHHALNDARAGMFNYLKTPKNT
ncbi:hypothetical protein [Herbaspirillum robiniae]|uniref:hypothetical protein n=1 Tax=Herbaspirillum robiniae TaxID=2014887 RepID=UPI003D783C8B